jgi:hypothetical protein
MKKVIITIMALALMLLSVSCEKKKPQTDTIDFEEISLGESGTWIGTDNSGGLISGNAFFPNYFNADWNDYWSGFAFTNHTDILTPGYDNMYSSITGSGADDSEQYAVFYFSGMPDTIKFTTAEKITRISVCNTTNTYFSMLNGDAFGKKFGGESGNDPDWYKVILTGIDGDGDAVGYVEILLADFRFDNNSLDYIANAWTNVDLSPLGYISALEVKIESSDLGDFGFNTPTFVCIDNIEGVLLTFDE